MRIKLTTNVHGAWKGKTGDELDRPELEAKRLIAGGYAISLEPPAKLETADTVEVLETTSMKA